MCAPLPAHSPPQLPTEVSGKMADDFQGGSIDILIGIDNLYRVVLWDKVEVGEGLRAVDTVFGFVMHALGKTDSTRPSFEPTSSVGWRTCGTRLAGNLGDGAV